MSQKELYNNKDYKLVKIDKRTEGTIFGPNHSDEQKFINVAALYSVSTFEHGMETCKILKHLNPGAQRVLDATVCVGGNTGPLAKEFPFVFGTEIDPNNFILAKNNLREHLKDNPKGNLKLYNSSCINFLDENPQGFDAIVFDPPWNIRDLPEISHASIGIPGVSLKDNIYFFLQFTDFIILKTSRNDDVRYYQEYLSGTRYEVLCIEISNYKLMLIAPRGSPGLDFNNYEIPEFRTFNYKKILNEAGLL